MKTLLGSLIFLGAFLSFQLQPLTGKALLPDFGSMPSVWTTCLIFFQVALLLGYYYAHLLRTYLSLKSQLMAHLLLMGAATLILPLDIGSDTNNVFSEPQAQVFLELMRDIGPLFVILAATTPLLQSWFVKAYPAAEGWRLYALSNLGSVLALLGYPLLLDTYFGLFIQQSFWSILYVVYGALLTLTAFKLSTAPDNAAKSTVLQKIISIKEILRWLSLSAVSCFFLVAISTRLTQDIPATPIIFTIPLLLYLSTFILTFDKPQTYSRLVALIGLALALIAYWVETTATYDLSTHTRVGLICAAGSFVFYAMHGELARALPDKSQSTLFYLVIALGGALGGILSGLVSPILFNDFVEYPLGLMCAVTIAAYIWHSEHRRFLRRSSAALSLITLAVIGTPVLTDSSRDTVHKKRNFFGVVTVNSEISNASATGSYRELLYGEILHGYQYTDQRSQVPHGYYAQNSGLGLAIQNTLLDSPDVPLSIGIIGLGTGQIATWASPTVIGGGAISVADRMDFYEINPEIEVIAENLFTHMSEARARGAHINTIIGDGRIALQEKLERDGAKQYDIIVMDAFVGGAIPTHLVTLESMFLYRSLLKSNGVIAVHISNRYVDLKPVMKALAQEFGMWSGLVNSEHDEVHSEWVLLSPSPFFFQQPQVKNAVDAIPGEARLWTDNFHSIVPLLK